MVWWEGIFILYFTCKVLIELNENELVEEKEM